MSESSALSLSSSPAPTRGARPYVAPALQSSGAFERLALSCTGVNGSGRSSDCDGVGQLGKMQGSCNSCTGSS